MPEHVRSPFEDQTRAALSELSLGDLEKARNNQQFAPFLSIINKMIVEQKHPVRPGPREVEEPGGQLTPGPGLPGGNFPPFVNPAFTPQQPSNVRPPGAAIPGSGATTESGPPFKRAPTGGGPLTAMPSDEFSKGMVEGAKKIIENVLPSDEDRERFNKLLDKGKVLTETKPKDIPMGSSTGRAGLPRAATSLSPGTIPAEIPDFKPDPTELPREAVGQEALDFPLPVGPTSDSPIVAPVKSSLPVGIPPTIAETGSAVYPDIGTRPAEIIQGPQPTTPEQHKSLMDKWMEVLESPELAAGLAQFGLNIMQNRSPGQSSLQQFSIAAAQGGKAAGRVRETKRTQDTEERELKIKEKAAGQDIKRSEAQIKRFESQTKTDLARIKTGKGKIELENRVLKVRQQLADDTRFKNAADIINDMWQRAIKEASKSTETLTGKVIETDSELANFLFNAKMVKAGYMALQEIMNDAKLKAALTDNARRAQLIKQFGRTAVEVEERRLGLN